MMPAQRTDEDCNGARGPEAPPLLHGSARSSSPRRARPTAPTRTAPARASRYRWAKLISSRSRSWPTAPSRGCALAEAIADGVDVVITEQHQQPDVDVTPRA